MGTAAVRVAQRKIKALRSLISMMDTLLYQIGLRLRHRRDERAVIFQCGAAASNDGVETWVIMPYHTGHNNIKPSREIAWESANVSDAE